MGQRPWLTGGDTHTPVTAVESCFSTETGAVAAGPRWDPTPSLRRPGPWYPEAPGESMVQTKHVQC